MAWLKCLDSMPKPTPAFFGRMYLFNFHYCFQQWSETLAEKFSLMSMVYCVFAEFSLDLWFVGDSSGPVCYYFGKKGTIYEDLGHAEVVQLDLSNDSNRAKKEMEKFATTYFSQFKKTRSAFSLSVLHIFLSGHTSGDIMDKNPSYYQQWFWIDMIYGSKILPNSKPLGLNIDFRQFALVLFSPIFSPKTDSCWTRGENIQSKPLSATDNSYCAWNASWTHPFWNLLQSSLCCLSWSLND